VRPKLKPYFKHVTSSENGIIRVKMERTSLEINDPEGKVMAFIDCLDGERTLEEIAQKCLMSTEDAWNGVQMLNQYNMLEALDQEPMGLTEREQLRYKNNLTYFSHYETLEESKYVFQQRLKDSKVAVLGLGSGSVIAAWLASMGVGKIVGVDYDRVELNNLNRQFFYTEDDVGDLKTQATKRRLEKLNSDIQVEVYEKEIDSAAFLIDILDGVDFVVNAIDSPPVQGTRYVNAACLHHRIPAIHIAIGNTIGFFYRVTPFVNGCTDCRLLETIRNDASALERMRRRVDGTLPKVDFGNPGFAPNVATLTSLVASEVCKQLTGYHKGQQHAFTIWDVHSFQLHGKDFPRLPECPSCGSARTHQSVEPCSLAEIVDIVEGMHAR